MTVTFIGRRGAARLLHAIQKTAQKGDKGQSTKAEEKGTKEDRSPRRKEVQES